MDPRFDEQNGYLEMDRVLLSVTTTMFFYAFPIQVPEYNPRLSVPTHLTRSLIIIKNVLWSTAILECQRYNDRKQTVGLGDELSVCQILWLEAGGGHYWSPSFVSRLSPFNRL